LLLMRKSIKRAIWMKNQRQCWVCNSESFHAGALRISIVMRRVLSDKRVSQRSTNPWKLWPLLFCIPFLYLALMASKQPRLHTHVYPYTCTHTLMHLTIYLYLFDWWK
jgi:hypothetical protein